ncbi:MAG: T9SS type A sorting domain-containing protein [Chitinophagaceae bacterium]|nr:T9SS type A sorting domain-containing protein [Chitinophagaceae bacterium]
MYKNVKNSQHQNAITVVPNPFIDQIKINTDINADGKISIKIINSNGYTVADKSFDAKKGMNEFRLNNLGNLASGIYIIKVISAAGNNINTYRLVK